MKQKLLNKLWLRVGMIVAIMTTALSGTVWAETVILVSGSGTSSYAVPTGWTTSGTVEGGSYLKFDNGTITSPEIAPHTGLSFAYTVATFGSGTNHPLTIRILNASTNAVIVEKTTATPTSSSYINTDSPLSLGDVNVAFKIQLYAPSGKGVRLRNYSITGTPGGGTQLETVATPTFSVDEGTYTSAQTVSISCETSDATIYYTTDGNTPTTSSSVYSSALAISETTTVKAIAVKEGMNNSAVASATYTINIPYSGEDYVRISSLDDLTDGAKVIIASRFNTAQTTGYYAMTAAASGKPEGVKFSSTTSSNGEILPAKIVDNESTYCWIVGVTANSYTFTNESGYVLGYNSSTNFAEGGNNTEWSIARATAGNSAMVSGYEGFYITNKNNTGRGIAFNGTLYGPYATSNNNSSNYNFYVDIFVQGYTPSTDPSISASDVNIDYDATNGNITYTLENEVTGGVLTAAITAGNTGNWLNVGNPSNNNASGTIALTCSANTGEARTATVTLTYTYNTNETVTKDVTVTQDAAPVIYTTIPALFAAATSTATDVNITFGGWVVSAVHSNNAYLTDNQGNGLIIYATGHGFQAGDVLTGTVSCKLQLYRGSAELTELTTSTTGLSVAHNGTVTEQNIAISELSGVNTGALVAYEGLTYNGTALVDGNSNTITPYATLFSGTFENGKTYNVTGIYLQYNTTKELLPRSADDIEEVVIITPAITVASTAIDVPAAGEDDVIDVTYENITSVVAEVQFFEADGVTPATYSWITADINNDNDIEYIVDENTGAARTAYMKVYALDNEANDVYSDLITITQAAYVAPFASTTWTLASSITSGKHYIIVGMNGDNAYAMGEQKSNNRAGEGSVTVSGTTASVSSADVQEFFIYGPDADGLYTIYDETGYLYAASSNANNLKTEANVNDNARWEITFNEGAASIVATQSSNRNVMRFNYNNGSPLFACYASASQAPVYLYEKVGEATPTESKTLNGSGYATYCSQNALDFTNNSDVTAWAITAANSTTGVITFSQIEGKVPAGTGMLLKGTPNGSATMTSSTGATALTNNLLIGTTAKKTVSAGEYYGLSGNTFVPVNAGDVPAGKALLPASALSSNVKAFTFVFEDDATGIEETLSNSPLKGENIYNLAGQMVNGKSVNGKLPKGIYIVNGKKVMIK